MLFSSTVTTGEKRSQTCPTPKVKSNARDRVRSRRSKTRPPAQPQEAPTPKEEQVLEPRPASVLIAFGSKKELPSRCAWIARCRFLLTDAAQLPRRDAAFRVSRGRVLPPAILLVSLLSIAIRQARRVLTSEVYNESVRFDFRSSFRDAAFKKQERCDENYPCHLLRPSRFECPLERAE